ncbi:putative cartilage matrix-associated protein isoform X2 [Pelodiscus sinensis]|uniref:putative cartilage matrix-associated protein isoform X2 n=1 Tax=Pelodiscus sinensis TaxID=13735 RepID=UPI003F6B52C9
MNWKQILFLSCLATFVLLVVLQESDSAAVGTGKAAGEKDKESVKKKIFIQESDASNFFKKRGKRATKSRAELNAETRQMLIADEQRREYFDEQRNEFENFVKEERKVETLPAVRTHSRAF